MVCQPADQSDRKSQIAEIDLNNRLIQLVVEGFRADHTCAIEMVQGLVGMVWLSMKGDHSPGWVGSQQRFGGMTCFDRAFVSSKGYRQMLFKGAGGVLGLKCDSVWFQCLSEALVRWNLDLLSQLSTELNSRG